jgi:hypothetical protein
MRRICFLAIAVAVLAVPAVVMAGGGDGGFDGVVHSIEGRYGVRATHIPFLGLMSMISNRATHGSVAGIHVVEFESFRQDVDGNELNQLVQQKLGAGWERFIRETSRSGHDQTLIFTRPEGDRMDMFVVDLDGDEMDVVEVAVDPAHLDEDIGQYRHHHHNESKNTEVGAGDTE